MNQDLQKIRDEKAYEYDSPIHRQCYGCCQNDSDYQKAFRAGFDSCYEHLLSCCVDVGKEQRTVASVLFQPALRSMISRGQAMDLAIQMNESNHSRLTSIYEAKLAEKDAEIMELKKYEQGYKEMTYQKCPNCGYVGCQRGKFVCDDIIQKLEKQIADRDAEVLKLKEEIENMSYEMMGDDL